MKSEHNTSALPINLSMLGKISIIPPGQLAG